MLCQCFFAVKFKHCHGESLEAGPQLLRLLRSPWSINSHASTAMVGSDRKGDHQSRTVRPWLLAQDRVMLQTMISCRISMLNLSDSTIFQGMIQ